MDCLFALLIVIFGKLLLPSISGFEIERRGVVIATPGAAVEVHVSSSWQQFSYVSYFGVHWDGMLTVAP